MGLLRNVVVGAFGLLMVFIASYAVRHGRCPARRSSVRHAAVAAFMGAMTIVDQSRPFLRISEWEIGWTQS